MTLVPATIRDHVIKCCTTDYLGTYRYPNGFNSPAISVGKPLSDIKISGVEVIIPTFPRVDRVTRTGTYTYREECWELVLLQHSGNHLFTCVDRLTKYFMHSHGTYIGRTSNISQVEMYQFTIKHKDLYQVL